MDGFRAFISYSNLRSQALQKHLLDIEDGIENGSIPLTAPTSSDGDSLDGRKITNSDLAISFPSLELSNHLITHSDFQGSSFCGFEIKVAKFLSCILTDAQFDRVVANRVTMEQVDCRFSSWINAIVTNSSFDHIDFSGATLRGCDFSNSNLVGSIFRGVDAAGANFDGADLRDCDFSGANLKGARLSRSQLDNTSFMFATLTTELMHPVDFRKANYYGARLDNGVVPVKWPQLLPKNVIRLMADVRCYSVLRDLTWLRGYRPLLARFKHIDQIGLPWSRIRTN